MTIQEYIKHTQGVLDRTIGLVAIENGDIVANLSELCDYELDNNGIHCEIKVDTADDRVTIKSMSRLPRVCQVFKKSVSVEGYKIVVTCFFTN